MMMHFQGKVSRSTWLGVFLLGLALWFPAQGVKAIGISPNLIEVNDVTNQSRITKQVILTRLNPAKTEYFAVSKEGTGARYIVLQSDTVALPQGEQKVPIFFTIQPISAPQGTYEVRLTFVPTQPKDNATKLGGSTAGMTVLVGASARVVFSVTNKEIREFEIVSVTPSPLEEGQQAVMSFLLRNKGNVDARPDRIELTLIDETDRTHVITDQVEGDALTLVSAGAEEQVVVAFTKTLEQGTYQGSIRFVVDGATVYEKQDMSIVVYPQGTLSQSAKVVALTVNKTTFAQGELVKFDGVLENTGESSLEGVLYVNLMRGSAIVDLLKSEKKVLPARKQGAFSLTFKPEQGGTYTAEAYFEYGAQRTPSEKLSFTVQGGNFMLILMVLVGIAMGGAVLVMWMYKKKQRSIYIDVKDMRLKKGGEFA